jgi:hypothetical protein
VNVLNDTQPREAEGDEDAAVRRFVERFAQLLMEAGMPRMPSRAFACLLAEDSGRLTAAEFAERVQVSPAGRRIDETREFFAFLQEELPAAMQRWRERRAARAT